VVSLAVFLFFLVLCFLGLAFFWGTSQLMHGSMR
jgi:hypothetical protein